MMRGVAGSAHRRLIPLALLGGGLFAVIADLLSRVLIAPEELPVGVISAFFWSAFFPVSDPEREQRKDVREVMRQ